MSIQPYQLEPEHSSEDIEEQGSDSEEEDEIGNSNRLVVKVGGQTLLGACVINEHLCRLKRSVSVAKNSRFCRR